MSERVEFPARKVTFNYYHPNIGDKFFAPMIHEAALEHYEKNPLMSGNMDTYEFIASNGVRITVSNGDSHE